MFQLRSVMTLATVLVSFCLWCGCGESPRDNAVTATDLARCLTEKGYVFYGTSWDGVTLAQAWDFGDGFDEVNYVRCDDPLGTDVYRQRCSDSGIMYLPAWVNENSGEVLYGSQALSALADASGCAAPEDWLEDDRYDLAECLNEQGAVLYGSNWCHYCTMQLDVFGAAVEEINYVKCDEPEHETTCDEMSIIAYPTWVFGDDGRIIGFWYPWTLAEITGCDWPEQPDFHLDR